MGGRDAPVRRRKLGIGNNYRKGTEKGHRGRLLDNNRAAGGEDAAPELGNDFLVLFLSMNHNQDSEQTATSPRPNGWRSQRLRVGSPFICLLLTQLANPSPPQVSFPKRAVRFAQRGPPEAERETDWSADGSWPQPGYFIFQRRRCDCPAEERGRLGSGRTYAGNRLYPSISVGGSPTDTGESPMLPIPGASAMKYSGPMRVRCWSRSYKYATPTAFRAPLRRGVWDLEIVSVIRRRYEEMLRERAGNGKIGGLEG
jgi:hypothetical protein